MTEYAIYETSEYREWLAAQTLKSKRQIQSRVLKIECDGHFGARRYLERYDLWEIKFNDGRRIYYVVIPERKIILLLGGNKNGQTKDIQNAARIFRKFVKDQS